MTCLNPEAPVTKPPVSQIPVEYDLESYLAPGDTIEPTPDPEFRSLPPGLTFGPPTFSQDSRSIQVLVSDGAEYQDYQALMKFSTTLGAVEQVSMWVRVLST